MSDDIFRIPGKEWFVRYSTEHGWGCASGDGPLWFADDGNFMPLLPLLEISWQAANDLVKTAIEAHASVTAFPFDSIVLTALNWPTEYWPTLAVQWLEQGFPLVAETAAQLAAISVNKAMPQRLRHRSLALLKHSTLASTAIR